MAETTFTAATAAFEGWLSAQTPMDPAELAYKHRRFRDPADFFPFFRGTYYRWAWHWQRLPLDCREAPEVVAVGDVHVENFGTWRDAEGRLVWGINDFDEVDELPYTQDLVRLAASFQVASRSVDLRLPLPFVCQHLLQGYTHALEEGGIPFVLEENHAGLRGLAMTKRREPSRFWKKLTRLLAEPAVKPPPGARNLLVRDLPPSDGIVEFRRRLQVGMGSLGKPRFVALLQSQGSWLAREAKAATQPATVWATESRPRNLLPLVEAIRSSVRCPDPFYLVDQGWIARRLAPRCSRIELRHLNRELDQEHLIRAMGAEIANIHLSRPKLVQEVLRDLKKRGRDWLGRPVREMLKALRADADEFRRDKGKVSS